MSLIKQDNELAKSAKASKTGPIVFYHAECTDGYGAAFCAWLKLGDSAQYIPVQFGQVNDLGELTKIVDVSGRDVYVLDFAFTVDLTMKLLEVCNKVVWLDHHKSSFDGWCGEDYLTSTRTVFEDYITLNNPEESHYILLDTERSGAGLTWDYFFVGESRPKLIALIEDYDLARFDYENTNEFILGLHALGQWGFKEWKELLEEVGSLGEPDSEKFSSILSKGLTCITFQDKLVKESVNETMAIHLPGEVLSGQAAPSSILLANDVGIELLNNGARFAACWFLQSDGRIKCSLRSKGDVDVEEIARRFGGGGHPRSSAFRVKASEFLGWLSPK